MATRARSLLPFVLRVLVGSVLLVAAAGMLWCRSGDREQAASESTAVSLLTAIQRADRAGFEATFAATADEGRISQLWDNFAQLDVVTLTAREQAWQVVWRVPGESGVASHQVSPRWSCGPLRCELADIVQQPGMPAPLWLTGPISVHRAGAVAVIGGPDADQWLSPAARAAEQLSQTPSAVALLRPGALQVIEVPADADAFAQVLAQPALEFRGAGAITWTASSGGEVPTSEQVTSRIVVNPDATAGLTDGQRQSLMLHEQTHAATSWLAAPAAGRQWVSEGLAEWVRLRHPVADDSYPAAQPGGCVTGSVPADADFQGLGDTTDAYRWSEAAIGQIMSRPDATAVVQRLWRDPAEPLPALTSCG
jgi:hypothetical protein